jgi:spermidine synthase
MAYLRSDARSLPFSVMPRNPRVLVIGSAGGHEVLASLFFNAERVTGVELNPATLSLLTDRFADFAGRIHEADGVRLIADEGRSFLQRTEETYDLIWLVAPDSYAAMNAATGGAFVLSESYLYTVEMIRESMRHLTDEGVICAQFGELSYEKKPNRTVRYLSTAREALAGEGALDFDRRVFVATSSDMPPFALSTVIIAKTAFTQEQVRVLSERTRAVTGGVERYKPGDEHGSSPVNTVIRLPEALLAAWYAGYPYDVTPVSDDSPFFWKFTRLRDALVPLTDPGPLIDWEDTIGERILLVLLGLVTLLAGIFLLLPLLSLFRVWRRIPYKGRIGLYFAALGVGFMLIEVSLIQSLTLFLGYPTYSLSVTLFGILTCAGIGSAASGRHGQRLHRSLAWLLGALIALVLIHQYAMPTVVRHFIGAPLPLRILLALLMIGPIGFCMGGFLPLGLQVAASVTEHSREYVAWSWAVNGFFSVLSSILATILAMTIGFQAVQIVALGAYVLGVLALSRVPAGSGSSG